MTDNTKAYKPRQRKSKGPVSDDLLDQLLSQVRGHDAESLLGESGLVGQLKKQLAERMLSAELNHHLATERASGDVSRAIRRCAIIIDLCLSNGTHHSSSPAARKNAARRCRCPRVRTREVSTACSRAGRLAGAKFARSPYLVCPQTCSTGLRSGA